MKKCVHSFFPFILCLILHFWVNDEIQKNEIVNFDKLRIFTKDSSKRSVDIVFMVKTDSSCVKSQKKYHKRGNTNKGAPITITGSYNNYWITNSYKDGKDTLSVEK